jgi:hypothetical protein
MPGKPKPIDKTKTLEYARKHGDLEGFIKEHETSRKGDLDKMDAVLKQATGVKRPARGSAKATRKASSKASSGD